jgi:hypothetical protein
MQNKQAKREIEGENRDSKSNSNRNFFTTAKDVLQTGNKTSPPLANTLLQLKHNTPFVNNPNVCCNNDLCQ